MILPTQLRQLYPFESNYFNLDGLRYHFLDEGEGEPMLCVHGNPTWSFYYREMVKAFRSQRRVIVPDHIGCGLSDKPQNYPYRLANHVENLERLVLDLDLSEITLVVHDWGGPIGLGVAGRHPDRFRRLVITNTAAFTSNHMPFLLHLCRIPVLGELLIRGFNAFAGLAPVLAVADRQCITPAIREGYLFPYDSWANRIATHRFVADIPMDPKHPTYPELIRVEEGLRRLEHCPVQLFWGDKDWVFRPTFASRFSEFFPSAEVHHFPEVGHLVVEEAFERILPRLRDFLA